MNYGVFQEHGSVYEVKVPHTPVPWQNYLFNQEYHTKVSQLLQGESSCLVPFERMISRGTRSFYLKDRDSGEIWSPNEVNGEPNSGQEAGSYSCRHALGWSGLANRTSWCAAELKGFVPLEGSMEIWICKITNLSSESRTFSLFSAFAPETGGMGVKGWYDRENHTIFTHTFPYHVRYEDKEKYDACRNVVFMFSDQDAHSYESSERRYYGPDGSGVIPAAVRNGCCSNLICEGEAPVTAMEHRLALEAGETAEMLFAFGCVQSPDEIPAVRSKWSDIPAALQGLEAVEHYWSERNRSFHIHTPDSHLDSFMNYWLKKQVAAMTETHRFSNLSCVRNELQDAIGYSMMAPEKAHGYLLQVFREQESKGYLRQYRMRSPLQGPAGLALLNHKDALAWLLLCTCVIVQQTAAPELLDERVEYSDSPESASVYEHLLSAIGHMREDRGSHGLCLMGDGDWTDPINGAGRLGRGESAWTTMAFLYGVRQFIPFAEARKDNNTLDMLLRLVDELDEVINDTCWDGEWYLAGYDDEGRPFGTSTDAEGQIYLNAQTWAIISGAARGERLVRCLSAIDKLDTDSGPVVVWPSFSEWDGRIGKISIKRQGTTENGSVYCHASLFKAYADILAGRPEKGYETIVKTLPGSKLNPVERNLQVPIWVPNFYFGLTESPNFGKSSMNHSTGTAAWILWTVMESILGVRSTIYGLEVNPQVPQEWDSFEVRRMYKGSEYRMEFSRKRAGEQEGLEILVNGESIHGSLLPWEPKSQFDVQIRYE